MAFIGYICMFFDPKSWAYSERVKKSGPLLDTAILQISIHLQIPAIRKNAQFPCSFIQFGCASDRF